MIVESKAIEPKAGSATSIYPAVIVGMSDYSNDIIKLHVYCPSVMSGDHITAKITSNNWVEAPRKPHNGADDYDFDLGSVIIISYQDGNVNSPQFVRYVTISDEVKEQNKRYIEKNIPISNTDILISIMDDIVIGDPKISIGANLLSLIETGNNIHKCFHTYYSKSIGTFLNNKYNKDCIYRCGIFGTELIYNEISNKNSEESGGKAQFSYLDENNRYDGFATYFNYSSFRYIINYLAQKDTDAKIIDIVNKTIKEIDNIDEVFSPINESDIAFWWTQLAGYIPSNHNLVVSGYNFDLSEVTKPPKNTIISTVVCNYEGIIKVQDKSIYKPRWTGDSDYYKIEDVFTFIDKLWYNICTDSFFKSLLSSRYAIILTNNLANIKTHYNCKTNYNKTLIILTVIATAFPNLAPIILNFDYFYNYNDEYTTSIIDDNIKENFVYPIKESLKNDNLELSISQENLAEYFTILYFRKLGITKEDTGYFYDVQDAWKEIYNRIFGIISYIYFDYNNIKDKLYVPTESDLENASSYGFVWPIPNVYTITSPFGYRTFTDVNGKVVTNMHYGVDLAGNNCFGKPVVAVADGEIIKIVNKYPANETNQTSGNLVQIKHTGYTDKVVTTYKHLLDTKDANGKTWSLGDKIKQGEVLGHCDNTGYSTGSHLHFEVIINNKYKDPINGGYIKR